MPLTQKQRKFIAAYAGNGTEAARVAGYDGNDATLAQVASENLRKPEIAAAIKAREGKAVKRIIADREERQAFWSEVMRGGMQKEGFDPDPFSVDPMAKIGLADRLRASELLGKSEADFVDRTEGTQEITIRILEVADDE